MYAVNVTPERLFQALADSTRIRVVRLMVINEEEACLCELVDSLLEPQYKVSRHLKLLRQAGLITAEKDGRWVYHRLVKDVPHLQTLYEILRSLPDPEGIYGEDLKRFRSRMNLRDGGRCRVGILTEDLSPKVGGSRTLAIARQNKYSAV